MYGHTWANYILIPNFAWKSHMIDERFVSKEPYEPWLTCQPTTQSSMTDLIV